MTKQSRIYDDYPNIEIVEENNRVKEVIVDDYVVWELDENGIGYFTGAGK